MDEPLRLDQAISRLTAAAADMRFGLETADLGRVLGVENGVATVEGLATAFIDELVVFSDGTAGQVFDLDRDRTRCVLFGSEHGVRAGSWVTHSGDLPVIPVGRAILGRVMNPLGQPQDELGELPKVTQRRIEQVAPHALQRQPIHQALLTGIKVVDAAIPVGLGQRQLILGDRATGKTSLALDAIVNQRGREIACVYVSIGAKGSSVAEVVAELRDQDAMAYTAVVVASADAPAALRYLAPFAGCSIAEWIAYAGGHALVVYDDLTRHAEAYRELSLLLRRPPSREAYPGDIFSVHARLIERGFKLSNELGGGSVTALAIAETQRGNITGFIPTNLISMTDGQVFLDAGLFSQGQLPAVDIGLSVSRVGRDAQSAAMQDAAADLRTELAQYAEVKDFTRFGAILDETTKRQIERGKRLLQVLAQGERARVPLAVTLAELWALRDGLLDDLPPDQIPLLEQRLIQLFQAHAGPYESMVQSKNAVAAELRQAFTLWVRQAKSTLSSGIL